MLTRLVMTVCATLLALSLPTRAVGQSLPAGFVVTDAVGQPLGVLVAYGPFGPGAGAASPVMAVPIGDGTWSALFTVGRRQIFDGPEPGTFSLLAGLLFPQNGCQGDPLLLDPGSPSIFFPQPDGFVQGVIGPFPDRFAYGHNFDEPARSETVRSRFRSGECSLVQSGPVPVRPAQVLVDPSEYVTPFRLVPQWGTPP